MTDIAPTAKDAEPQGMEFVRTEQDPRDIPTLYFNSFTMAISPGDCLINLHLNGKPNLTLNASFTTIKTLGFALSKMLDHLEAKTSHTIMTLEDTSRALNADE